jgi:cell division protein FtsQ
MTLRRRALLVAIAAAAMALAYYGWFRDSSLVAVRDVKVEGVGSLDRSRIVGALTDAARGMTTLHVQSDRLEEAVRSFPTVASVSAEPSFPSGLTIRVTEHRPALVATDGNRTVPVAANGALLPGLKVTANGLPELRVGTLPGAGRLSGEPLAEALAIGAAPAPLRSLIEGAALSGDYGVVLTMRGGIELRFGTDGDPRPKWQAVAAILADRSLTSVTYVDVRVPSRPAVGGTPDPSPAVTSATTPSAGTASAVP